MNKSRFLITTSERSTWEIDNPIIFLGEWCIGPEEEKILKSLDYIVAKPYGVTQIQKDIDYTKVNAIKSKMIGELGELFNNLYGINYSKRYWRIIMGLWLHRYISIIYNRYFTLKDAFRNHRINRTIIINSEDNSLVTYDSADFLFASNQSKWNSILFSKILKYIINTDKLDNIDIKEKNIEFYNIYNKSDLNKSSFINESVKNTLALLRFLSKNTDSFIHKSYLHPYYLIKLNLKLREVPLIWGRITPKTYLPDKELRNNLKNKFTKTVHNDLERCIKQLFFELLPTIYLEGYPQLLKELKYLPWPKRPKFIFTSTSFDTDEIFKLYTAEKVEEGVKYFIGQHGSNYGVTKNNYSEEECIATSDNFITWGWKDNNPKYCPAFIFKTKKKSKIKSDKDGRLLLINNSKFSPVETWDTHYEFKQALNSQFNFVELLQPHIRKKATIRLHPAYRIYDTNENILWSKKYNDIHLDQGNLKLRKIVSRSRLVVFSYDSTGFLELLSLNIPTICFINGNLDYLRDNAHYYYKLLIDEGIFHLNSNSAAEFVNNIWDNIASWWLSQKLQQAREIFCKNYANHVNNPVETLLNIMER